MTGCWVARTMRKVWIGIAILLAVIAVLGQVWGAQPGGTGTRIVITVAGAVCPGIRAPHHGSVTVADGAHDLDAAVLDRALDAITGGERCSVSQADRPGR